MTKSSDLESDTLSAALEYRDRVVERRKRENSPDVTYSPPSNTNNNNKSSRKKAAVNDIDDMFEADSKLNYFVETMKNVQNSKSLLLN